MKTIQKHKITSKVGTAQAKFLKLQKKKQKKKNPMWTYFPFTCHEVDEVENIHMLCANEKMSTIIHLIIPETMKYDNKGNDNIIPFEYQAIICNLILFPPCSYI